MNSQIAVPPFLETTIDLSETGQLEKSVINIRRAFLKELPLLIPEERHALAMILGVYLISRAKEMKPPSLVEEAPVLVTLH